MTKGKRIQKKQEPELKTFNVPLDLGEIKEDITNITITNNFSSKEQIINNAFKFHSQGKISEAVKYYQQFINQGFNDQTVFSNYGAILKDLGNLKEAEKLIRRAIEINPEFADAHYNLGIILNDLGNLKEAIYSYRKAIQLKPSFENAYYNLGNIFKDLGQLNEAESSINKAIELNPNSANFHSSLGSILRKIGKLQEAEISTRKAIELKPDCANAHTILGNILNDLGELKEAEAILKKAITLKTGLTQAHGSLSSVLEKLGRHKEAEESAIGILYLTPEKHSKAGDTLTVQNSLFKAPRPLEYMDFYRPGMGTENVGGFLRSMLMMARPNRVLEIGAGYTTPFLLEGIINNERVFDDGNLRESYFKNYIYKSKLLIIDNQTQGELTKSNGMKEIINSNYTEFIEGKFEGKAKDLYNKYGYFDFVWFDCGGSNEYVSFIKEFWEYCSSYIFFHFTYSNGKPNINHKIIHENIKGNPVIIDIVEPHKKRQGSITMVKKESFKHKV